MEKLCKRFNDYKLPNVARLYFIYKTTKENLVEAKWNLTDSDFAETSTLLCKHMKKFHRIVPQKKSPGGWIEHTDRREVSLLLGGFKEGKDGTVEIVTVTQYLEFFVKTASFLPEGTRIQLNELFGGFLEFEKAPKIPFQSSMSGKTMH